MPSLRMKMKVDGAAIAKLAAKLGQIDRKIARKALKQGINEITKNVLWTAKSLVPKRTGQLRRSLGRIVKVYRGGSTVVGIVGPRKGFKIVINGVPINPVKYAHLVEFGRREVVAKNKKVLAGDGTPLAGRAAKSYKGGAGKVFFGKKVRSVPPCPFMGPAWDEAEKTATETILGYLRQAMKGLFSGGVSG